MNKKMSNTPAAPKFIPALSFNWLTPFYDRLLKLTMPEETIKTALISEIKVSAPSDILDFGCGSGTLTIMLKTAHPLANISGVDVDIDILNRAKERRSKTMADINLIRYNGEGLPFKDASFDIVVYCLVFHHIYSSQKSAILKEIYRILKSGGQLIIADFGRSASAWQRFKFNMIRILDGFESTEANAKGLLPGLINEAGFKKITISEHFKTLFGEVQIIMAYKKG
ncbi:MAG: methyltransferase type 11 [Mucilaginibacter sp.]|nr:MAG: methyltransferase type 11 [Mucilaginibacter sp.]HEK19039.1 class I SAM-dependent methyltransferase [Bacteroidota bacterium]